MGKAQHERRGNGRAAIEALEGRTLMSVVQVGPEALVNFGNTTGSQTLTSRQGSVAADQNGNYVVVWEGATQGAKINAQRYDSSGNPVGGNVVVSGLGYNPGIAMAANGSCVVSWADYADGSDMGVYFQRFDSGGNKVGGVIRANTYTAGKQNNQSTALLDDGRLAVTWVSAGQDGSGNGVFGQRFAADNAKIGSEFRVNNETAGDQGSSTIATDQSDGEFLVTWEHTRPATATTPPIRSVHAQRFSFNPPAVTATNPTGEVGGEFRVDDPTTAHSTSQPSVAFGPDGGFVFAWAETPGVSMNYFWEYAWINFRKYAADGAPLTGPIRIDSGIDAYRGGGGDVSVDPAGNAVVAWRDTQGDHGNFYGIYARRIDAAGVPTGVPFRVNPNKGFFVSGSGGMGSASLAHLGADKFVAAYTYDAGTGTSYDVYTQRVEEVTGKAHDVEVVGVYGPTHTDLGKTVAVPVTVRNVGTSPEDVTVTLRNAGGTVVGSGTAFLAPDAGTTLMIGWAGSETLPANWYDVTATVTLASGENDTADGKDTGADRVRFGVVATLLTSNTMLAGTTAIYRTLYGAGLSVGTTYNFVGGTGPAPTVSNILFLHEGRVGMDITTYWSKKDKKARTGGTWDLILTNLDGSTYRLVGALRIV